MPIPGTPQNSRAVRDTTLKALAVIDTFKIAHPHLRKLVVNLAHVAEHGMTEGIIQRQRAQDLERALVQRNNNKTSKRGKITTNVAVTGVELLEMRN